MTRILSTNITSPLGLTTKENYAAVKRGETGLIELDGCLGVPGHFCVGILPDVQREKLQVDGLTWFESLVFHSVKDALDRASVDVSSLRTAFILGTSTASIEELGDVPEKDGNFAAPGVSARRVAARLGFTSIPITVSNACISGGAAQMLADRLIGAGFYDTAVVCGADALSPFVLAGFDSFKSMSPTECRPFDIERVGLNIGECAATIIVTKEPQDSTDGWHVVDGCLNNDAYHVSAPIPSGDGLCRTILNVLTPALKSSLACVTAHGTATMFNDQMESKAIENAGLSDCPTTAYKSHFGHTFGASGVVEAIITMCSLDEGIILPIRGFEEIGVSGRINICDSVLHTDKKTFIKTQSGFGSCNGTIAYSKNYMPVKPRGLYIYETARSLLITPTTLTLDGNSVSVNASGSALISEIYKTYLSDGSRFFKMDLYSRLAYVGTGLLAKEALDGYKPEDLAILLFTLNGSLLADRKHLSSFSTPGEYYPSPAVFINTLPNVVLGEIAVRNKIKGETTLVLLPSRDEATINCVVEATLQATRPSAMICGWVDCEAEDSFIADLKILKINN